MRRLFVDTAFYVAILNRRDNLRGEAQALHLRLLGESGLAFVTTEAVLVELLTRMGGLGPEARTLAFAFVSHTVQDLQVTVVPSASDLFAQALDLYRRRPDKTYSMTDCMSMIVCREHGITEVLTSDHDFEQEGFTILLGGRP